MEDRRNPPQSRAALASVALIIALAAIAAVWGIATRAKALAAVTKETQDLSTPTMAVVKPVRGVPQEELTLPATVQPFADAPIYARTNGYLKRWTVDIGAHVKRGQLLAEIDAPEVDQQLQQARADLRTAESNAKLA